MYDPTLFAPAVVRRFEAKIQETPEGCWIWQAATDRDGYGRFRPTPKRDAMAHRWSYEYHVAEIPNGLQLDHLCRVRACVNPAHLEPVTGSVNVRRGSSPPAALAAATNCPNGHEYTEANTYIKNSSNRRAHRACRQCKRENDQRNGRKRRLRRAG